MIKVQQQQEGSQRGVNLATAAQAKATEVMRGFERLEKGPLRGGVRGKTKVEVVMKLSGRAAKNNCLQPTSFEANDHE